MYAQAYAHEGRLTSAQKMVAMKDLDMGGFEVRAAPYMLPPPPLRPLPEVGRMSRPPPLVFLNIGVFAYKAQAVQLLSSAAPSPKNHTPLRSATQTREALPESGRLSLLHNKGCPPCVCRAIWPS